MLEKYSIKTKEKRMAEIKSKYFKVLEFEVSDTAKKRHIDNTIPGQLIPHIQEVVVILDAIREAWGSGIRVTSGYRSLALNKAVGGSTTSAHSHAYAADIVPTNGKIEEFKKFVINFLNTHPQYKWDQVINEYSGASSWIHIGVRNGAGAQRRQWLLYKNGKYTTFRP